MASPTIERQLSYNLCAKAVSPLPAPDWPSAHSRPACLLSTVHPPKAVNPTPASNKLCRVPSLITIEFEGVNGKISMNVTEQAVFAIPV